MYKNDGESVDHLLLHCSYAYNLGSFVFSFLGVSWVMPKRVGELLACWYGGVWRHRTASIWGDIPHCIIWTIWREWNNRTFEGEWSITELKHIFILSLFEWITSLSGLPISSLLDFLDLCSFVWHFVSLCTLPVYQGSCFCCTTIFFFNKVFYLPIKNK